MFRSGWSSFLVFATFACSPNGANSPNGTSENAGGLAGTPASGAGGVANVSGSAPLGESGSGGVLAMSGGANAGGGGGAGGAAPVVSCAGASNAQPLPGATSVLVARDQTQGALPHFWSSFGIGRFGLLLQKDRDWGSTLREHIQDGVQNLGLEQLRAHGLFHDDLGLYHDSGSGPVYDFTAIDAIFDFLVQQGITPIAELAGMPKDLARDPSKTTFDWKMGISPPKDWAKWQQLNYTVTKHWVERYGADKVATWHFEVWNEPECCNGGFWSGTLDEYFELYDYAVQGVRAALPNARVGGPVASQPAELTGNSQLGKKFLSHVTTANSATAGTSSPLDVFSYHAWFFLPAAVDGYFQALTLLDSYGLKTDVAVTEYGATWQFNLDPEPQETTQGAAFVANTFSELVRRCTTEKKRLPKAYAYWTLSDIFDEGPYREEDPFIGAMGLISRQGIHKPTYNVFKMLNQLGDESVALTLSGDASGVGGIATRDADGGTELLLYNAQSPGAGPPNGPYYAAAAERVITVQFSGLDAATPLDLSVYKVDETHGNAYAAWQALGHRHLSALTDANWTTLRSAMDSVPIDQERALCGSSITRNVTLGSPGVLLITIKPSR